MKDPNYFKGGYKPDKKDAKFWEMVIERTQKCADLETGEIPGNIRVRTLLFAIDGIYLLMMDVVVLLEIASILLEEVWKNTVA